MWPWEHLAFGYLLYSAYTHLRHGRAPESLPVVALGIATQFPDVVDKPLAWTLDFLPTARSLGHSVFVAVLLVAVVGVIARWRGDTAVGPAVAIGYGSHLVGDVLYGVLRGGDVEVGFLLWPLVRQPVRETPGLYERTLELLLEFGTYLGSPVGRSYLAVELTVLLAVFVLWVADGRPGLPFHR